MCVIITHRCKWNQCLSEGLWDLEFGRQSVFRRGRPLVVTEGDCGTGSRDRLSVHGAFTVLCNAHNKFSNGAVL